MISSSIPRLRLSALVQKIHQHPFNSFSTQYVLHTGKIFNSNSEREATNNSTEMDIQELKYLREQYSELLKQRNDVTIKPSKNHQVITFRPKTSGQAEKKVTVTNTKMSAVQLKDIYLANPKEDCKYQLPLFKTGKLPIITLSPSSKFVFEIQCSLTKQGRPHELCIFDFGEFKMARWLTLELSPENEKMLLKPEKEVKKVEQDNLKKEKSLLKKGLLKLEREHYIRLISRFDDATISPSIPEQELKRAFPTMSPDDWTTLTPQNYLTRFQVALWFENITAEKRDPCGIHNAELRAVGRSLVIQLDGTNSHRLIHRLYDGSPVRCFKLGEGADGTAYEGRVTRIKKHADDGLVVFMKFNDKTFHEFCGSFSETPVYLQFCPDETIYERQKRALVIAVENWGMDLLFPKTLNLKPSRIDFVEGTKGELMPSGTDMSQKVELCWFNNKLGEEQKDAVRGVLTGSCRPLPYIIFGPPGTGKTMTVVEAILQVYMMDQKSKILATAPSNVAADVIATHLISSGLFVPGDLVRFNGFIRSETGVVPEFISDFCKDGEDLTEILKHRVIISTVNTAGQFLDMGGKKPKFSHVFIDEAGYCTEPESMIALTLADLANDGQLILAGDPKQLGPVLMCNLKTTDILNISFLERLMDTSIYSRDETTFPDTKYNPALLTKLLRNYRSHEILLKVPSQLFYEDELVPCASYSDAYDLCGQLNFLPKKNVPLIFHGCEGHCMKDVDSTSWYNLTEVNDIVNYFKLLRSNGVSSSDIGIITPYRKQVEKVTAALLNQLCRDESKLPKVATLEEFQGGERKVIIISTVRSDSEARVAKNFSRMDFIYSKKRFNVALTRAKALMVVVGNPNVLVHDPGWEKLLRHAVELGVYVGCPLPRRMNSEFSSINLADILSSQESTAPV